MTAFMNPNTCIVIAIEANIQKADFYRIETSFFEENSTSLVDD